MNLDLRTTQLLELYLQGAEPDQAAQTLLQGFRQEVLETTDELADRQTAFEAGANSVIEEIEASGTLKAQEQRLKELQHQASLLKLFQQQQQGNIAKINTQITQQIGQLMQSQSELQQLSARAAMPRQSPYVDKITALQEKLINYLGSSS